MKKRRIAKMFFIPTMTLVGLGMGIFFYTPMSLPTCQDDNRNNDDLSQMFRSQAESAGLNVLEVAIDNNADRYDPKREVRSCLSTVVLQGEKSGIEKTFVYKTEFDIKWQNKWRRTYYIEVLSLTDLTNRKGDYKKDLNELTAGFKNIGFYGDNPPPILITPLYQTPSLRPATETRDDVTEHDISFFATTEDGDSFVTLFKENNQTVFIIGTKETVQYKYIVPKLNPVSSAGGSVSFEDDGVSYQLIADKMGGVVLHIRDGSGHYQLPLDTSNAQYINRLPPLIPN